MESEFTQIMSEPTVKELIKIIKKDALISKGATTNKITIIKLTPFSKLNINCNYIIR
jgi:hypothetical protein